MTVDSADATSRIAKTTALFCSIAGALYGFAQVEPSWAVGVFFSAAPLLAAVLWLQRDAARTGVGSVHDLGMFLWIAWPVVIPWYAFKTRGRRGWRLIFRLFALIGSAYIGWIVTTLLVYVVRYQMWYLHR